MARNRFEVSTENDPGFTPEEVLTNARRISLDNANIAVKAMGMLGECQQKLQDLVDAFSHGTQQEEVRAYNTAIELLAKQKETKLYN